MKIAIIFLLFASLSIAKQSSYPLEYTFNDSNFFIKSIQKPYEGNSIPIILQNPEDKYLIIEERLIEHPICSEIKTMIELNEYKKLSPIPCTKIFNLIYNKKINIVNLEKFNILVYQNKDANIYTAVIFKQGKFIGIMHTNMDLTIFSRILESFKDNINNLKEQDFIFNAKKHFDKSEINSALKNLISVMLINPNNKEAKILLEKVYSLQETILLENKNVLSEL